MLIELFGLPGSGKTVFSNINKKKYILIDLNSFFEKYFYFFKFIIKHPYVSFYLFKELIYNIEIYNANYFRIFVHKFYGNYITTFSKFEKYKAKKLSSKKYIIDEGFMQLLFSIYDKKSSNIIKTLKLIENFSDIYFIFSISEKTREKRLKIRKEIPRLHFGENYYNSWKKSSFKTYIFLEKYIKDKKEFKIIK